MAGDSLRQGANVILALTQIAAAIVTSSGMTGPSMGAISRQYPTYVVPAGYAFSIWSLIYALSLAYAVFQALPRHRESALLRRIGWFTACAFLAATLWVFVFQGGRYVLSVLVILVLLASLAIVIARIVPYRTRLTNLEWWLVYATFSIFLGWVTVATIANVAQTLVALDWNGWGISDVAWGVIMLLAAAVIASAVTASTRANIPYALTVLWALAGVAANAFDGRPPESVTTGVTAIAAAIAVTITLLVSRLRLSSR